MHQIQRLSPSGRVFHYASEPFRPELELVPVNGRLQSQIAAARGLEAYQHRAAARGRHDRGRGRELHGLDRLYENAGLPAKENLQVSNLHVSKVKPVSDSSSSRSLRTNPSVRCLLNLCRFLCGIRFLKAASKALVKSQSLHS